MAALSNAKIKKTLVDNLPNVVWFCHVEREECIRNLRQLRFIMTDFTGSRSRRIAMTPSFLY